VRATIRRKCEAGGWIVSELPTSQDFRVTLKEGQGDRVWFNQEYAS
jgi:hypothetical protein